MIKDFFEKIITRLDNSDTKIANVQDELKNVHAELADVNAEITSVHTKIANVHTELNDTQTELKNFRQEQREVNERLEKKIDMNSDSISMLSTELRAAEKMEFAIYNHEGRITKLEKAN